jgi:hypothetical protein
MGLSARALEVIKAKLKINVRAKTLMVLLRMPYSSIGFLKDRSLGGEDWWENL